MVIVDNMISLRKVHHYCSVVYCSLLFTKPSSFFFFSPEGTQLDYTPQAASIAECGPLWLSSSHGTRPEVICATLAHRTFLHEITYSFSSWSADGLVYPRLTLEPMCWWWQSQALDPWGRAELHPSMQDSRTWPEWETSLCSAIGILIFNCYGNQSYFD